MIHADPNLYLHNNFVYIDRTAYINSVVKIAINYSPNSP